MKYIAKFILWLLGWKTMEPPIEEPKCIVLGVPHTSGWDFVISFLYYRAVGGKGSIIVKKELLEGPFGRFVKYMGGVPIDRKKGATAARQMIDIINKVDTIHLAIAIEGSRKRTEKWKAGFHFIARTCNIPVYLGYFDWGRKQVGRGVKIELTDNVEADLKRIKAHYKKIGVVGKYPEMFTTDDDHAD